MIATLGRGILGLTVQCARCHNHKFDPIAQKDYYRLQASLFGYVEVDHPLATPAGSGGVPRRQLADDRGARQGAARRRSARIEQPYREELLPEKYKKFPENVQIAIRTPEAQRTPGQVLLADQIIRTTRVSAREIDRIMKPEDLAQKRRSPKPNSRASKKRSPRRFRWPWGSPTATTASRRTVRATSRRRAKA